MKTQGLGLHVVHRPITERYYSHLQDDATNIHLDRLRLLLPPGDPWWKRWKTCFERVGETERVPDTAGPLGCSADILGHLYPVRRRSFVLSSLLVALAFLTLGAVGLGGRYFVASPPSTRTLVTLVMPPDLSSAKLRANKVRTSLSGGGAREPLPASRGKLPKPALRQFAPPRVDPPKQPKLAMEPTLIAPPDIQVSNSNLPTWGNPLAKLGPLSNGPGSGGGIGSGTGGGIGDGFGPGHPAVKKAGSGIMAGGGVIPPRAIKRQPPAYTAEAFESKLEGKVVLQVLVSPDGTARVLRIVSGLPMGLTQAAIEAVQKWTFEPGRRNGQAIGMEATVTIFFRL